MVKDLVDTVYFGDLIRRTSKNPFFGTSSDINCIADHDTATPILLLFSFLLCLSVNSYQYMGKRLRTSNHIGQNHSITMSQAVRGVLLNPLRLNHVRYFFCRKILKCDLMSVPLSRKAHPARKRQLMCTSEFGSYSFVQASKHFTKESFDT